MNIEWLLFDPNDGVEKWCTENEKPLFVAARKFLAGDMDGLELSLMAFKAFSRHWRDEPALSAIWCVRAVARGRIDVAKHAAARAYARFKRNEVERIHIVWIQGSRLDEGHDYQKIIQKLKVDMKAAWDAEREIVASLQKLHE